MTNNRKIKIYSRLILFGYVVALIGYGVLLSIAISIPENPRGNDAFVAYFAGVGYLGLGLLLFIIGFISLFIGQRIEENFPEAIYYSRLSPVMFMTLPFAQIFFF